MAISYIKLNRYIFPLPNPRKERPSILDKLPVGVVMSLIDVNMGIWQIPLTEESKKYTAFHTQDDHWEWNVLPMGLKEAAKTFLALMQNEFKIELGDWIHILPEKILVISRNNKDHKSHLWTFFKALQRLELTVR